MNVTGKATVTLGAQTYQFDVSSIKLGIGQNDEPDEVMFVGADSKVWGAGTPQTSFTVPMENISPELVDLISGVNSGRVVRSGQDAVIRERITRNPDGSESWIETMIVEGAQRMRTCYASEWSDYLDVPFGRCECCTCKFERITLKDAHCPTHGEHGARACRLHNTGGFPYTYEENSPITGSKVYTVHPQSVQEFEAEMEDKYGRRG